VGIIEYGLKVGAMEFEIGIKKFKHNEYIFESTKLNPDPNNRVLIDDFMMLNSPTSGIVKFNNNSFALY
jgi:hypothetical protein